MGIPSLIHDIATSPEVRADASDFATKTFSSMEKEGLKSKAGQLWLKVLHEDYLPTLDRTATKLGLKDIKSTDIPEVRTKSFDLYNISRNIASDIAFGKNQGLLAGIIKAAKDERGEVHAQNLADHMAMILHDNDVIPRFKGKRVAELRHVSKVKYNAVENKEYGKELGKFLNTNPVYTSQTPMERSLYSFAHLTLAPFAAIGHIGTFANALTSVPFKDLNASLLGMMKDYQGTKTGLLSSGIFQEDVLNTVRQQVDYRTGKLAKYLSGTYADMLNRAVHMPGLRGIRNLQITMFGSAGMHTAQDMAQVLVKDPTNARALYELRDMHIDPAKVLKQGGQLTQDQIESGIYHFVNNHVFLHPEVERAFYAQQNMWTRQASMFHSFTSAQGRFIRNEIKKAWTLKGSDPANFVRTFGALGVAFPTMGFAIKQLENLARGTFSEDDTQDQVGNLAGKHGAKAAIEEYFDDLAYVAGFGIAGSYVRGAFRNSLSNMMLGPIGNVVGRGIVDSSHFLTTGDAKPLARDVLTYGFPDNIGKVLTHKVLPTKTDKNRGKHHMKQLRMGLKGLSMNP